METEKGCMETKVDVGILKSQVLTLSSLCTKMDTVIDKLIVQQERLSEKFYTDLEHRRLETEDNINELHARIDTAIDKIQASEMRVMDEIKALREEISKANKEERETIQKFNEWKYTIVGAIVVLTWIISHVNFDTVLHMLK